VTNVIWLLKGCCHSNRFREQIGEIGLINLHSAHRFHNGLDDLKGRFKKIKWQWSIYIPWKFRELLSSNSSEIYYVEMCNLGGRRGRIGENANLSKHSPDGRWQHQYWCIPVVHWQAVYTKIKFRFSRHITAGFVTHFQFHLNWTTYDSCAAGGLFTIGRTTVVRPTSRLCPVQFRSVQMKIRQDEVRWDEWCERVLTCARNCRMTMQHSFKALLHCWLLWVWPSVWFTAGEESSASDLLRDEWNVKLYTLNHFRANKSPSYRHTQRAVLCVSGESFYSVVTIRSTNRKEYVVYRTAQLRLVYVRLQGHLSTYCKATVQQFLCDSWAFSML